MSVTLKWSRYIPHTPTVKQTAFLILPHGEALFGGAAGGGKGLPPESGVLTPWGFKPIGELKPSDPVCATDGSVTRVISVSHRGIQPRYRLYWHNGVTTVCDEDHIWLGWITGKSRKISNDRVHGRPGARKWVTKDLVDWFSSSKTKMRHRFAIPTIQSPQSLGLYLDRIEKLPPGPTVCIQVSHPNSLFITDGYIVTHNSDALLMGALQYVDVPGFAGIIFRKTLTDLKLPGALIDRSHQWLCNTNARWASGEHTWYFPTVDHEGKEAEPSKLVFGYVGEQRGEASNVLRHQSAEYQYIAWDELTQHSAEDYRYLFSRRRKIACPIHKVDGRGSPRYVKECPLCDRYRTLPLRVRSATNPGGPGAAWVRRRFRIGPNIDPRLAEREGKNVRWIGKHPDRPFIPSFLEDNPYLDQVTYDDGLRQLDPVTREQLRRGNWGISPDSRFKRHWARYYSNRGDYFVLGPDGRGPEHSYQSLQRIFATVDPAGSTKESPGSTQIWRQAPSYTVISVWGLTHDFNLLWLDMSRFRKEVPDIIHALKDVYRRWKPIYFSIESNGLGRGVCQYASITGLPVRPVSRMSDKLVNATDAMVRMEQGRIWLPEQAPWLGTVEDELFTWTGHPYAESDDIIDTLADAARDVSWEAAHTEMVYDEVLSQVAQEGPEIISDPYAPSRMGLDPFTFS